MEEISSLSKELVQLARLSLNGSRRDVELYIRRLIRKVQKWDADSAEELVAILSQLPKRTSAVRSVEMDSESIPVDKDSRLSLLKIEIDPLIEMEPILNSHIKFELNEVVQERARLKDLLLGGVEPTKTLLFVGPPGVGKSLSAKVLSKKLNLPLFTLDLSAVMSSFLGRTGGNIRNVFDYAKTTNCILFLDELDSIAKKRDDSAEVGELKRLVTVLLQELDGWPSDNLLIAATNHDELLDPAVWRRFDRIIKFPTPTPAQIIEIINSELLGFSDFKTEYFEVLMHLLKNQSHAEIIREIKNIKKTAILSNQGFDLAIENHLMALVQRLPHDERIRIADILYKSGQLSQRKISDLTSVSRDTIRKNANLS